MPRISAKKKKRAIILFKQQTTLNRLRVSVDQGDLWEMQTCYLQIHVFGYTKCTPIKSLTPDVKDKQVMLMLDND